MVYVKTQIGGLLSNQETCIECPHCCKQTHEKMCKYNFLVEFTNVKPGITDVKPGNSNEYISYFSIYTKRS